MPEDLKGRSMLRAWVRARLTPSRGVWRLTIAASVAVLALGAGIPMIVHAALAPNSSRVLCSGWSRCSAHGYNSYGYGRHEWTSYWRMTAGDECTNYVAFVESTVYHVRTPSYLLGNAYQWAATAAANGVPVNRKPSVGAVAEWDAGAPGMGGLGHVAVVEAVGPGGKYIVISQQNMGGYSDFNWTLIQKGTTAWQEWPSHFIHFRVPAWADPGYFNPKTHTVSLRDSQTSGPVNAGGRLGSGTIVPLVGDWRGTGNDGLGFYKPKYGTFHLLGAHKLRHRLANLEFRFGPPGMVPLVGDWTGIGRDGIGYYDPKTGTFALRESLTSGPPQFKFKLGPPGMVPLVGDWKGGPRDAVGYYNPKTGVFYLRNSLSTGPAFRTFAFGPPHMIPLVGNWLGGRKDEVGFYKPGSGFFHLRDKQSSGRASTIFQFGPGHMVPLVGDWFGTPRFR